MMSNEMDRAPATGIDPRRIRPMGKKLVIKRTLGAERVGKLFVPAGAKARRPQFEGDVIALGAEPPPEYADLAVGDHVWFSYQVGGDDSAFLTWEDASYAVIPFDAVACVRAAGD